MASLAERLGFVRKGGSGKKPLSPERAVRRLQALNPVEVMDYGEVFMVTFGRALDEMRHGVTPPEMAIPEAERALEQAWAVVQDLKRRLGMGTL